MSEDAAPLPRHPPPPRPPLLGLSFELHVARLPTASCDKPSCLLTTSFLMLAGETRAADDVCVCVRATNTHTCYHTGFKETLSKKRKSFQMTKHRLLDECLLLIVFISSVHRCCSVSCLFWVLIYPLLFSAVKSVYPRFVFLQVFFLCFPFFVFPLPL